VVIVVDDAPDFHQLEMVVVPDPLGMVTFVATLPHYYATKVVRILHPCVVIEIMAIHQY